MSLDIDLGPEFKQENLEQRETETKAPQGPIVTLTTKLQYAHEVLKSRQAIKELFKEFDMKPDEIEALQERIKTAAKTYNEFQKEHRMLAIAKQMNSMGITLDELRDYHDKEASTGPRRKGPKKFVMAVIDGIEVYNVGPIPKEVQAKGYRNRKGFPMEVLTMEWKLQKGLIGG